MKISFVIFLSLSLSQCVSNSVVLHEQTPVFIDIESKAEDFWLGCTAPIPENPVTIMTFYLKKGETTYEFLHRRFEPHDFCLRVQESYRRLIGNVDRVRVVGIQPFSGNSKTNKLAPKRFHENKEVRTWYFVRLETKLGCKSYFDGGCKKENYWAGTYPSGHEYWKNNEKSGK